MTLEVVLTHEFLATPVALVLPVSQVRLDMRANVFPPAKDFTALRVQTSPLTSALVLLADVTLNLFWRDTCVFESGIEIELGQHRGTRQRA